MIEIDEVKIRPLAEPLTAWELEQPGAGNRGTAAAIAVRGWVLGATQPAVTVRIESDGRILRSLKVNVPRSDIAERFPQSPWARTCGFWTHLAAAELPANVNFRLTVEMQDGSTMELGHIHGRHQCASTFTPTMQPLMVTSLGRTGTTWLMRLLAEHPQIVAYRAYPYETRAASYWMHMLRVLTQPAVHPQPGSDLNLRNPDAVSQPPFFIGALVSGENEPSRWLMSTYPARVAEFCQENIESFYQAVAKEHRKSIPSFFLEKYLPDTLTTMVRNMYAGSKELVLVRDLRDTLCSIMAFNAKRGFVGFGRDEVASDEEYVVRLAAGAEGLLRIMKSRDTKLVQYEKLILEPEQTIDELLTYVGLESTPNIIEGMRRRASRDTAELREHRTSRDLSASLGRWQDEMSPTLQDVCRRVLGPILIELGYELDPPRVRRVAPISQQPRADEPPVLVVSRGDEEVLEHVCATGPAWHFPRAENGDYAGFYPADSGGAIAHLEALRTLGAQWLYFPPSAVWWLEHYSGFREHLESQYSPAESPVPGGRMFHLKAVVSAQLASVEKE